MVSKKSRTHYVSIFGKNCRELTYANISAILKMEKFPALRSEFPFYRKKILLVSTQITNRKEGIIMNSPPNVDSPTQRIGQVPLRFDDGSDMLDWWVGTVILTFFPIIISIIISLCRNGNIDFQRMVGDGELILSAFLVTTPSIMNYYRGSSIKKEKSHKLMFYLLLFVAFFQLTAYTSIKTNSENKDNVVYITSALCVLSSIIIAWRGEKHLKGGNAK